MLWEREVEFKATLEQVARKPSKRLMAHAAQIAVEDHKVCYKHVSALVERQWRHAQPRERAALFYLSGKILRDAKRMHKAKSRYGERLGALLPGLVCGLAGAPEADCLRVAKLVVAWRAEQVLSAVDMAALMAALPAGILEHCGAAGAGMQTRAAGIGASTSPGHSAGGGAPQQQEPSSAELAGLAALSQEGSRSPTPAAPLAAALPGAVQAAAPSVPPWVAGGVTLWGSGTNTAQPGHHYRSQAPAPWHMHTQPPVQAGQHPSSSSAAPSALEANSRRDTDPANAPIAAASASIPVCPQLAPPAAASPLPSETMYDPFAAAESMGTPGTGPSPLGQNAHVQGTVSASAVRSSARQHSQAGMAAIPGLGLPVPLGVAASSIRPVAPARPQLQFGRALRERAAAVTGAAALGLQQVAAAPAAVQVLSGTPAQQQAPVQPAALPPWRQHTVHHTGDNAVSAPAATNGGPHTVAADQLASAPPAGQPRPKRLRPSRWEQAPDAESGPHAAHSDGLCGAGPGDLSAPSRRQQQQQHQELPKATLPPLPPPLPELQQQQTQPEEQQQCATLEAVVAIPPSAGTGGTSSGAAPAAPAPVLTAVKDDDYLQELLANPLVNLGDDEDDIYAGFK